MVSLTLYGKGWKELKQCNISDHLLMFIHLILSHELTIIINIFILYYNYKLYILPSKNMVNQVIEL